ncbi:MAG: ATP-binding protein [Pseudonocardiaceae bacterium]
MDWQFVGRTEQLKQLRDAFNNGASRPLIISGESGVGRSTLLLQALENVDVDRDTVIRTRPRPDRTSLSALSHLLPTGFDAWRTPALAVRAATDHLVQLAGQRRTVVVVDDAHLVDHATMLVLADLVRIGALVLLTRPMRVATPDPTECLRPVHTVHLPPLTMMEVETLLEALLTGPVRRTSAAAVHSATSGNPRRLRDLLIEQRLIDSMARQDGLWQLRPCPRGAATLRVSDPDGLVAAAEAAWSALELDRTEQLCHLAIWAGQGSRIPVVWAANLMIRGRADDAERFLTELLIAPSDEQTHCRLVIIRAVNLALGLGQVQIAERMLLDAAHHAGQWRGRLLAHRAWVLTLTGSPDAATRAANLAANGLGEDREAALMVKTARGVTALRTGAVATAIAHLRPARALADGQRLTLPWLRPYLDACLIDALLLAGRVREATRYANGFHGGAPSSGWDVAVAISTLTAAHAGGPPPR